MIRWPGTVDDLYAWLLCLAAGYWLVAHLADILSFGRISKNVSRHYKKAFDATAFATSSMLLVGILHAPVLAMLGDLRPFLIVSGLIGVAHSLHALVPEDVA